MFILYIEYRIIYLFKWIWDCPSFWGHCLICAALTTLKHAHKSRPSSHHWSQWTTEINKTVGTLIWIWHFHLNSSDRLKSPFTVLSQDLILNICKMHSAISTVLVFLQQFLINESNHIYSNSYDINILWNWISWALTFYKWFYNIVSHFTVSLQVQIWSKML